MHTPFQRRFATGLLVASITASSWAFTPSTQPPSTTAVPGNVLLALSVEFPTGLQVSYTATTYTSATKYEGYFDNRKCYTYDTTAEVFNPTSATTSTGCGGSAEWSGNLLNWLTMTNIDQFRSVMTGGTRDNFTSKALSNNSYHGDTVDRTILIRSFSDRNSYNPNKTLPNTAALPSAFRSKSVRSGGYGSKFIVSDSGFSDMSDAQRKQSCSEHSGLNRLGCFNIRVSACVMSAAQGVTGNTREANCQARYSGVAKPEGLVQEYAATLRFGAFGYLKQDGNDRNGAVLRAAMKSVGPVAATSTGVVANANAEWNTTTGVILSNPNPTDATASNVSNSGLMNYLNKFGYAAGYKSNDPVSELYYAAQRYMRGYALPSDYTSMPSDAATAASYKDGFPVITGNAHLRGGTRDPMINTCQRNFLLGIGDIYTHQDGQLPGRTGGPSDGDNLNVETLWTRLTTQEGSSSWTGGSSGGTQYMAGLAHWANTNDIRSDLSGTQTLSTYWVDVLENGNAVSGMPAAGTLKTQYWLAAKYGGFDTTLTPGDNPNIKLNETDPAAWDKNGDGVPDNWFAGSTPTLLKSSLSAAFSKINNEAGAAAASSAAVTSNRQTSSSQIIYAGYNPKDWTGSVRACTPNQTAVQCNTAPVWDASHWLNSAPTPVATADKLTATSRKIFTSHRATTAPYAFTSMRFQWDNLNANQQAVLNADSNGANRVDFIRGSRTHEGTLFRVRPTNLLGDVVNAGVTYLSGASRALNGSNFPGHAAYRDTTRTRPAVVYVGSNDGMLHAFSGTNGKELFGYIPGSVLSKLNGLSAFNFRHEYLVDSTPMVGDFEKTGSTAASPNWGTLLVGGLGAGGKGYYALDITSQSSFATSNEATLASTLPLWEFTSVDDADLGFTFNEPFIDNITGAYRQINKYADSTVASGVWRIAVGNGYGSTAGKAALFLLDANTGTAPTKLVADTSGANGLSAPTPLDTDRDGLIDTVYAGDLKGNLHKFQFSKESGSDFVLAKSAESGGAWRHLGIVYASGQPITTAPSVVAACEGAGWNVMFGTGKLNEDGDYADTAERGFYNVVDKSPSSTLTVPAADVAVIGAFSAVDLGGGAVGRNWSTPDLNGKRGWRMSFAGGERVLSNSTVPPDTGAIVFATTQPKGDVCTPGNSGYVMSVNICSGKIGDLIVNGRTVGGMAIDSSGIVKVSNTYTDKDGKPTVVCNQDDCGKGPDAAKLLPSSAPRGRYSWREILTK
ncbi:pilus assembly protein [Hydrogenophaga sp. BPS33]|uniref:pilus assembly protein n=1 Tax=Hydrogenophaga sp. BPS33 TaxID=2651974 RepID=UPI00132014C6|nr:PilC/PilY family type IV pilus protein [Hydrogenophaga sp. BPS33]QHE86827.1 hypothetical protein F9K07_18950 [Hydrogenophaga sp. BPS33]